MNPVFANPAGGNALAGPTVIWRETNFAWTMGSALINHLIITYPIFLLLVVAWTKVFPRPSCVELHCCPQGEGIEAFVEYPMYIPGSFILTYGITLMVVVVSTCISSASSS